MQSNGKKLIFYCCIMIGIAFIISLHPMISSTYASADKNSIIYYLCTFLPMGVLFALTSKWFENKLPSVFCAFATILTLGNASAMPLLRYTSAYEIDNVLTYSKSLCFNSLITVLLVPTVWICLWLYDKSNNEKRINNWLCIGITCFSVILSLLIFSFTDTESGTTIVHLPGISLQAALPVLIMSILSICLAWHNENKIIRCLLMCSVAVINISLFLRGETGIPLITLIAFSLWYYLLQPDRYRLISIFFPILLGVGIVGVYFIHILAPSLPNAGLLYSLSDKIEKRIFSSSVDQVERALRSIERGGFWGSNAYNVNVPEASSDFSLAAIIHYSGLVFLIIMLAAAIPMFYIGIKNYTESKHNICNDIGSMSMATLFVMVFYNLLMCSGHLPVLGVQIPFTGVSITYSILSSFLLGTITFSKNDVMKIFDKMKEGYLYAQG